MKIIRCESCGKSYDFDRSEVCPECGAFNNVQGGHGGGLMEASYRQEKMAQEKARRKYTAQEKQARQSHRQAHETERDAARWMEMEQKNPGQFGSSPPFAAARPKRSPKWLIALIIGAAVAINILPAGIVLLNALLFQNDVAADSSIPAEEWNSYEDYQIYFDGNKHKVTEDFFTTAQTADTPFWLGNLELTISRGEALELASVGWEMERYSQGTQLWIVPFQGMVTEVYQEEALWAVEAMLTVEVDGEFYDVYEEWDEDLWYALNNYGYQPGYVDDGLYGEIGQIYDGHLVFAVPAGAVPVQMQVDLLEFYDWEQWDNFDCKTIQRAIVNFQ